VKKRLIEGWEQLKIDWEKVININDQNDFDNKLIMLKTPLKELINNLFQNNKKDFKALQDLWKNSPHFF